MERCVGESRDDTLRRLYKFIGERTSGDGSGLTQKNSGGKELVTEQGEVALRLCKLMGVGGGGKDILPEQRVKGRA